MSQLNLFPKALNEVVNVASVPQRSPFRYPGGKTWLVPRVRDWLRYRAQKTGRRPPTLIEPFAGGGIVSLSAAAEKLCDRCVLVELDPEVSAVWETIIAGDAAQLAERIVSFELTMPNTLAAINTSPTNTLEMAFRTILKNRTFHGGILAAGSGLLKHGENGKGIRSRWYPETLKKRIMAIAAYRDRLQAIHGNAFEILASRSREKRTVWFIDPPYTAAGKKAGARLYTHFALDHEALFALAAKLKGDFLMTYDYAKGVEDLARKWGFETRPIAMQNTHHAPMKELLIGRDLDWVRE